MSILRRTVPTRLLALLLVTSATALAACAGPRAERVPAAPAPDTSTASAEAQAAYDRFARAFLDWYYQAHPVRATRLGIHRYDDRLPDLSREGIARQVEALEGWLARLGEIDRATLSGDAFLDYVILDHAIRAELLELREVGTWRKHPGHYPSAVAGALASLSSREFAPLAERAQNLLARMEASRALLETARENVTADSVPPLWAEEAVRTTRGVINFVRRDLGLALQAQGAAELDTLLLDRLDVARGALMGDLERYAAWIAVEIVPEARGDFRLGRDLFERKLRYEEHVDLSADELQRINRQAIADYHAWVAREAARIDPRREPGAIMDSLTAIHPTAEELLPTARRMLGEIRAFIVDRGIVTLPSDRMPTVRETPEYARQGFASMDTPGPFETVATEAFYNITNVDSAWTEEQKEQHLTYFNYPGLLGITVHEAMPGHFVQLLYEAQIPTEVRKVFTPASLVEGWAHYTEQMMVDEGLGGGDPAIRLGQLRRALQRHARWDAGLSMHAFGDSVETAAERFQEIAFFAPFPALRETQRGTNDPTYLYYALGRMQILKLREDYKRYVESRGERFTLRDFHDRFLRLGLPVSLARQVLIPGDTSPSL